jgi:hypothetical protein
MLLVNELKVRGASLHAFPSLLDANIFEVVYDAKGGVAAGD